MKSLKIKFKFFGTLIFSTLLIIVQLIQIPAANSIGTISVLNSGFTWAGSTSATLSPNTGWTILSTVSRDDEWLNIALGFNIIFEGSTYNTIQIHSNTYILFNNAGVTSPVDDTTNFSIYAGITPGNPAIPGIHMCSKDNSYQYIYYRFENNNTQLRVRYEGNNTTSGTVGSPTIIYEALFTQNSSTIDIGMGINSSCDSNSGLLGITDGKDSVLEATWPGAIYSSGYTLSNATAIKNKNYRITAASLTSSFNAFGLSGGATTATYRSASIITADVTVASKVTFKSSGVVISGCKNKLATGSGSSYTVTCSWRPSLRGKVNISAVSTSTDNSISGATAPPITITVANRSGAR